MICLQQLGNLQEPSGNAKIIEITGGVLTSGEGDLVRAGCDRLCQWLVLPAFLMAITAFAQDRGLMAREQRIALVVGNSAYQVGPLRNPANDADDMAAALQGLGFRVTKLKNASNREMVEAINRFGQELRNGGVGLFFFAGHGVQSRGRNFLIPVGASIGAEDQLEFESVDANRVLAAMDAAGNRVNIVILDACRDNPFARSFRSGSRGLAQMEAAKGSLVAFATGPGSVAADGTGRNGLYTQHLLQSLNHPDSDIDRVFRRVTADVARASGNKQVPWKQDSLTGEFYFKPGGGANVALAVPTTAPVAAPPTEAQTELAFWDSVKDSRSGEELQAYLDQYPKGKFTSLARTRLNAVSTPKPPAQVETIAPVTPVVAPQSAVSTTAGAVVNWRLSSSFPKALDRMYGAAELFAKRVGELTNGRFTIRVFAAGELVPALQVVDAVQNGTVELAQTFPHYFIGKDVAWGMGSYLPFALNARPNDLWLQGTGRNEFSRFIGQLGMIGIPMGTVTGDVDVATGSGSNLLSTLGGWWCRRPIEGTDSLKNLKVRIGGTEGQVWAKVGVVPVAIPGGEIYTALERGVIDCAAWFTPYDDERLGFYKVAPYFHYFPSQAGARSTMQSMLLINAAKWEELPTAYKAAVETAAAEGDRWMRTQYESLNLDALKRMVANGARVRSFSKDTTDALRAASLATYAEQSRSSPEFARLYGAWERARR